MVEAAEMPRALKVWRWRVFAATWLCYAGFYFCRTPYSIAKSEVGEQLNFNATMLGVIGAVYLVAYAVGQFASGFLGDRIGPRRTLLAGMVISVAANAGLGVTTSYAGFVALMAINGLAQATGWSNTVGTMANWFRRSERGTVMGVWATNYQAGPFLATLLASWAIGARGFQYSFFTGSLVLFAVWGFFIFNQRDKPADAGLAPLEDADEPRDDDSNRRLTGAQVLNVLLVGAFYFFVKFIRYSLTSWTPFFLARNYGLQGKDAGYVSAVFAVAGIAGVVVTGFISDKLFKSRRAGISLIMMVAMCASCVLLWVAGGVSIAVFAVCLALVGFTLYGPDALMSGAGAMDIGSKRHAVLAAGIINGMGSVGAVVQELVIGRAYDSTGGQLGPIFLLLLGSSVAAVLAIGLVFFRNRTGRSDV